MAAIGRFVQWQLRNKINKTPLVHNFIGDSKLMIRKGIPGATANLYMGLGEFKDMSFLLHFLRPDDIFADVGANIGSYTVLASAVCKAQSYSFEPIPQTFKYLKENIAVNKIEDLVQALPIGLGAKKETLAFTASLDLNNHVTNSTNPNEVNIAVEVMPLDDVAKNVSFNLLKIDVEGFETAVIQGAVKALENENLKAIIIELDGLGMQFGFDENKLDQHLQNQGFKKYNYDPFSRKLKAIPVFDFPNTIYLRDIDFIKNRLEGAKAFKVLGKKI